MPRLREELSLHPGPAGLDGAPTWTIRDPVRNRYFRIGWAAFEALNRWGGTAQEIADAVTAETTLHMDAEDVVQIAQFVMENHLTQPGSHADTVRLIDHAAASRHSWFNRLLHNYLFFRIPLVRPDRLLEIMLPLVAWLGSVWFRWASVGALVMGLILVIRQWELFTATLVDTFSLSGLVSYGIALSLVKVVHEFAHGLTAKRFGCRVPTMGLAFLVMWPVLYTDVNETWTLASRRQRLLVGAAGIMAELTVAAWATLAWAFLPEGPLRQAMFVLAALTWVSSLIINLSPFMRFDGYFLAMDALEMPNLHPRSFAMARWWLREALFGLGEPMPEPMNPGRRRALIAFAFAVWIYRLVLFLGIAVLVYHFFIKAVGILLFVVEIWWFIALPIWREIKEWLKRKDTIMVRKRWRRPLAALGLVLLAASLPWRTAVEAPAVMAAPAVTPIFLPMSARLTEVHVQRGQKVIAEAPLLTFVSPDLEHRIALVAARLAGKQAEFETSHLDSFARDRLSVLGGEIARLDAEVAALRAEASRLILTAAHDGTFFDPLPDLKPGQWLSPRQQLGLIRSDGMAHAIAYVAEADIDRIGVGAEVTFVPRGFDYPRMTGHVVSMEPAPAKVLAELSLASVHGGDIPVRPSGQMLVPDGGYHRVLIALDQAGADSKLMGHVLIEGRGKSLLGQIFRSATIVLIREWGV